uniref:Uncharacterized protein LOC111106120 n=1 Tax=Crassostrea virginica TaxID=6565 RepID=A0A8B8AYY6_CRAVI|nr:uncharacterized protein LOC111106120 [Crassostrea virginica]
MSTSPTALTTCGTTYPVWLKGSTPSDGASISMTACEVGFFGDCERQYTIEVKNCSHFLVYKLKPLDLCNAAYCFEHGDECVNETVSNVRVSFHNVTWKSQEHAFQAGSFQHDPYINLLCSFTPSADDTLLYHIDWYVDNDIVIQGQTVDKDSLQDAILSAEDLINANKKINSWIHCVVGIKAAEVKRPCFSKPSELFFAGIEILNETVTLQRSGSGHVMLRPTIPIIAPTLEYPEINPQVDMVNVELSISNNNNGQCRVKHRDCEKQIEVFSYGERERYNDPNNWRKVYSITVQSLDDAKYNLPGTYLVQRLNIGIVNGGGGSIYSNVPLHDVRINVVENNSLWKGRICVASADVHMTSLDGYKYECQAMGCVKEKTYILYRNKDYLQEVQVRHMTCWTWLSTTCVCAVAIRVGRDVFTIDACNGGRIINFPSCYENALKVVKELDTIYKVTLPTGTLVKIRLFRRGSESQWYMNVEVYPTERDVLRTEGLCGSLDGNRINDLWHRNGIVDDITSFDRVTHPNSFSVSWQ